MSSTSPNVYIVTKTYNYLHILAKELVLTDFQVTQFSSLIIIRSSIGYWFLTSHDN